MAETKRNPAVTVGLFLAAAAILGLGPRLVLILLNADRHYLSEDWTRALLATSGIGTAAVLTFGGVFIAHQAARLQSGPLRNLWLVMLALTGMMTSPLVVAGLRGVKLPSVLDGSSTPSTTSAVLAQWGWALLVVLLVEVVAGGCMWAAALSQKAETELEEARGAAEQAQLDLRRLKTESKLAEKEGRAAQEQLRKQLDEALSRLAQQGADHARELAESRAGHELELARARSAQPVGPGVRPRPVLAARGEDEADLAALIPCRNADRGCTFRGVYMAERGHQRSCEFKVAANA